MDELPTTDGGRGVGRPGMVSGRGFLDDDSQVITENPLP